MTAPRTDTMSTTLRAGWTIEPTYRGCTTVREWSARYRGIHVSSFDHKRDAVDYINNSWDARNYEHRDRDAATSLSFFADPHVSPTQE
jgi:hypothetical protein